MAALLSAACRGDLSALLRDEDGEVFLDDARMSPREVVLTMVITQLATSLLQTAEGDAVKAEYEDQLDRVFRFMATGADPLPEDHPGFEFEWSAASFGLPSVARAA